MDGHYCMYLRKSRKDQEAEIYGAGETLANHEKELNALASRMNIKIERIYREIVSGDTIAARPQMQQLLQDIESGMWTGVLVTEIERLGRGATIDQGIISQVFSLSGCKIITLNKTYDPNNEFDEEYFEYGLFQSRREYKAINRRQQRGAVQALSDGKWVYNKCPYGYRTVKLQNEKGYKLEIIPEQAEIIKLIYDSYSEKKMGYGAIGDMLRNMNIDADTRSWSASCIQAILKNPVYCGYVKRGQRGHKKTTVNGQLKISRPREQEYRKWSGLHQAIISEEQFNKVQEMFESHDKHPLGMHLEVKNALAGLVYCKKCGKKMTRRPYPKGNPNALIMCTNKNCDNIAGDQLTMTDKTISILKSYLASMESNYIPDDNSSNLRINVLQHTREELFTQIKEENAKLNRAYDLVEQGVYSPDEFLKRSTHLKTELSNLEAKLKKNETELEHENALLDKKENYIPRLRNALDIFYTVSPAEQNELLMELIERIDYLKETRSYRGPKDNFELFIQLKMPVD